MAKIYSRCPQCGKKGVYDCWGWPLTHMKSLDPGIEYLFSCRYCHKNWKHKRPEEKTW